MIDDACRSVDGFADFHRKFNRYATLHGRSNSLKTCYSRELARLALHYDTVPLHLTEEQIHEFLFLLSGEKLAPATFKFMVFSLKMAYKAFSIPAKSIQLPSVRHATKLPVVLSKAEVRRLIATPKLLKHKLILSLLYGCGLRCSEVRHLQLTDFDADRRVLHIRNGKGRKDRYVPINSYLIRMVYQYIEQERPELYLFHGRLDLAPGSDDVLYSQRGLQWMVNQHVKKAGIIKRVSAHTLRHTYATHLLEDGLDIVSIKELLGHAKLETTLIYLHVAQFDKIKSFSPLDTLFQGRKAMVCPYVQHQFG